MYKEMYVIFLLYEHVFSLLYEDGSTIDTKHRMLRVLDTPLLCRPPFDLDRKSPSFQTRGSVCLTRINPMELFLCCTF